MIDLLNTGVILGNAGNPERSQSPLRRTMAEFRKLLNTGLRRV